MFDDYNHGSDMKKNGTGGYPILTGDSNGNFKDFKSNIIQNIMLSCFVRSTIYSDSENVTSRKYYI